jgi:DNA-binding NarL/FixJ family response regulator
MKNNYNVLIIDDHPIIVEAYINSLKYIEQLKDEISFNVETAICCKTGIEKINELVKKKTIDLVLLDIRLPHEKNSEILSGEDLGIILRKIAPSAKIIVCTTFNDNYRIHSIFKNVNPEGFMIKGEISGRDLINSIVKVMDDPPYYSKSVLSLMRKQVSTEFSLDKIDRQILHELSIGTKMKELPKIIPLSIAGIEKRKRNLKLIFNVNEFDDRELILKAKENGFI